MSELTTKYERRCRCGRTFMTTDTEMAKGLGRYCGDGCLERSIADEKGAMYDFNFKPKGASRQSRTYEALVWLFYPRYTRYKYRHYDFSFVGNPKDKTLYRMVWQGPETVKHGKDFPSPIPYKELDILFRVVFNKSPEAMFQTFLKASNSEFELLHLQATLIS
jgi:hypothetical protein